MKIIYLLAIIFLMSCSDGDSILKSNECYDCKLVTTSTASGCGAETQTQVYETSIGELCGEDYEEAKKTLDNQTTTVNTGCVTAKSVGRLQCTRK